MELTEEQKQSIRSWAAEGLGLSDIQKKINSEFGHAMTYMDVRFLILDLEVELQDKVGAGTPVPDVSAPVAPEGIPQDEADGWQTADEAAAAPRPGNVSVDVDKITKPGSVVSGSVTFSDGVSATWVLDQLGRLAIDAGQPGYKPSEEDLRDFQTELRTALEKKGF